MMQQTEHSEKSNNHQLDMNSTGITFSISRWLGKKKDEAKSLEEGNCADMYQTDQWGSPKPYLNGQQQQHQQQQFQAPAPPTHNWNQQQQQYRSQQSYNESYEQYPQQITAQQQQPPSGQYGPTQPTFQQPSRRLSPNYSQHQPSQLAAQYQPQPYPSYNNVSRTNSMPSLQQSEQTSAEQSPVLPRQNLAPPTAQMSNNLSISSLNFQQQQHQPLYTSPPKTTNLPLSRCLSEASIDTTDSNTQQAQPLLQYHDAKYPNPQGQQQQQQWQGQQQVFGGGSVPYNQQYGNQRYLSSPSQFHFDDKMGATKRTKSATSANKDSLHLTKATRSNTRLNSGYKKVLLNFLSGDHDDSTPDDSTLEEEDLQNAPSPGGTRKASISWNHRRSVAHFHKQRSVRQLSTITLVSEPESVDVDLVKIPDQTTSSPVRSRGPILKISSPSMTTVSDGDQPWSPTKYQVTVRPTKAAIEAAVESTSPPTSTRRFASKNSR